MLQKTYNMAKINGIYAKRIKEEIESVFVSKEYAFFDNNKKYNLNIVGIRSTSHDSEKFDDTLLVIYRNDDNEWEVLNYEITTEPGPRILRRPINPKGTAVLVPEQYRSVYKITTHGGKNRHIALCQRNGKVKVWRDTDKDSKPESVGFDIDEGMYGINIHRHAGSGEKEYVNGSSAGCQVFKDSRKFKEFLEVCNRSADIYSSAFTYTLIEEEDLG